MLSYHEKTKASGMRAVSDIGRLFACFSEHTEPVRLFFQYNSDTDWTNISTQFYTNFPGLRMAKAFQNLDENSAKLLSAYLSGGAYFLARQWIMEEIPIPPKDVAAIVLNMLDKDRIF